MIENWYEERLYLEQTYQKKPDMKIVSVTTEYAYFETEANCRYHFCDIEKS